MGFKLCKNVSMNIDDIKSPLFWRAVLAEMIGTLFLVFVGCGSCTGWGNADEVHLQPTMIQIALAFGLSVATMVWAVGHVSGGHINPAVTVALLITRKISVIRSVLYIISQCIGAVIGAAILKGVTPGDRQGALGSTLVSTALGENQGFGVELMITFVLVFTVFACCDAQRNDLHGSAPLTIGLSVTMCHLFAIRFTGSSMNPARSFGPAAVQGIWTHHWVYWAGPILGGVMAGLIYDNLFAVNASLVKAKNYLLKAGYDPDMPESKKMKEIQNEQSRDDISDV